MSAVASRPASDLRLSARERSQIDQMVVTMAHLIDDGDFLAEGIGTFLPTSAYMLAKHTHAPDCTSLCPNGNTLMPGTRALTHCNAGGLATGGNGPGIIAIPTSPPSDAPDPASAPQRHRRACTARALPP